jgi:hypothetical protein
MDLLARRHSGPVRWLVAASLTLITLFGLCGQGGAQPPPAAGTYNLVDTWQDKGWQLRAGWYWQAVDATFSPDGRLWLLDREPDSGSFVHIFGVDGHPESVFHVSGSPSRIDADAAGNLHTLETVSGGPTGRQCILNTYNALGRLGSDSYPIDDWADCIDLAAGPGDQIYVTVSAPALSGTLLHEAPSYVAVLSGGSPIAEIDAETLYPVDHAQAVHRHPVFSAVDVGPDDRIYLGLYFAACG